MRLCLLLLFASTACFDGSPQNADDRQSSPESAASSSEPSRRPPEDEGRSRLFPEPVITCNLLADHGLPTSGYKLEEGEKWYCFGNRFTSAEGTIVPDEVSYTATGTQSRVREITIIAEHYVMNPDDEALTLSRASTAAEAALRALSPNSDPDAALKAFRSGVTGTWPIAGGAVVVERDEYLTGKGYSMYLYIRERTAS